MGQVVELGDECALTEPDTETRGDRLAEGDRENRGDVEDEGVTKTKEGVSLAVKVVDGENVRPEGDDVDEGDIDWDGDTVDEREPDAEDVVRGEDDDVEEVEVLAVTPGLNVLVTLTVRAAETVDVDDSESTDVAELMTVPVIVAVRELTNDKEIVGDPVTERVAAFVSVAPDDTLDEMELLAVRVDLVMSLAVIVAEADIVDDSVPVTEGEDVTEYVAEVVRVKIIVPEPVVDGEPFADVEEDNEAFGEVLSEDVVESEITVDGVLSVVRVIDGDEDIDEDRDAVGQPLCVTDFAAVNVMEAEDDTVLV